MKYLWLLYGLIISGISGWCFFNASLNEKWLGACSLKGASLAFLIYGLFILYNIVKEK